MTSARDTPATLRIALAQINTVVGDFDANAAKVSERILEAQEAGAPLVAFPELTLSGYPPEDLLLKEHFLADAWAALNHIALSTRGIVAVVGFPEKADRVFNAAAVLAEGEVKAIYRKVHLPNYGVFDERRYFQPGSHGAIFNLGEHRIGITVCEDIWETGSPLADEALGGASLVVNLSASPYHVDKGYQREQMFCQRARDNAVALAYCNLVGGQDELVFDGQSMVIDKAGVVIARAGQFAEELLVVDLDLAAEPDPVRAGAKARASATSPRVEMLGKIDLPTAANATPATNVSVISDPLGPEAEVYGALVLGLRDYVSKNGFQQAILGLSGGIDSALVACIAVDALGSERVNAVVMPSPYSSEQTQSDAHLMASGLKIESTQLAIEPVMAAYDQVLSDLFANHQPDLTEENLQARIRGNILMALSNKFGSIVLTTGNKSEMSVGYSTLYGDSAGGFAVIKDVPKTLVYRPARHRNQQSDAPIPEAILQRAPSAELRPGQRDDDSLPPYEILDPILEGYVENDLGREALVASGFDPADVDRVIGLVDRAEYKRRQQPPGIKITPRAFGRDRRIPITNRYGG
ncbi:MAG: NAD+ synthase [Solirubrobacterales bacterium]|nr:NAD+ synthase [Solirubrobacterales bacterium]